MKITLYKNCILSRSYSEVFDCKVQDGNGKTARDRYLETLDSRVYELDTVYSTNSGTINIPLEIPQSTDSLYDYNYMKVEYESITRFCFIDDIQFMNMIGVVYYSEDIWHSYIGNVELRDSYLTNAKLLNYENKTIDFFTLPLNLTTVRPREQYERWFDDNEYCLICEAQTVYNTDYVVTQKQEYTSVLCVPEFQYEDGTTTSYLALGDMINVINCLKRNEPFKWNVKSDAFMLKAYMQYGKMYVLPKTLGEVIIHDYLDTNVLDNFITQFATSSEFAYINPDIDRLGTIRRIEMFGIEPRYQQGSHYYPLYEVLAEYTIPYDRRTISIGTMFTDFPFENYGQDITAEIGCYFSVSDFTLLLAVQGKVIDISEAFTIEAPIQSISGSEYQQHQIAKNIATTNGVMNIVGGAVKLASGTSVAIDSANMLNNINSDIGLVEGALKRARSTKSKVLYRSQLRSLSYQKQRASADLYEDSDSGIMRSVSGASSIVNGIAELNGLAKEFYQTSYGNFSAKDKIGNIALGLVTKKIYEARESFTNSVIENVGYNVNEIVDDNIFKPILSTNDKNNILKFSFVKLYGKAPQSVIEKLKSILLNGTKIYYNENI